MNATEIGQMVILIESAYGAKMKQAGMPLELSVEVWATSLADIPWRPHGENALDWWIKRESWPPTPADIRNRAKRSMEHAETAKHGTMLLGQYGILPGVEPASLENAEAVMELVEAWEKGTLPTAGMRTACTQYDRFQTLIAIDKPSKMRLLKAIGALEAERVASEGGAMTDQGHITRGDLEQSSARAVWHEGKRVIQLSAGNYANGDPIYRNIPERRVDFNVSREEQ